MDGTIRYTVKANVIPNRVFYKGQSKQITEISERCVITRYKVDILDNKIKKVFLKDAKHPNADPRTGEFCLPLHLKDMKYSDESLDKIEKTMETFNLLSCYEIPYGMFQVEGGKL